MDSKAANVLAAGAAAGALIIGGLRRPSPDQPKTAAWYATLRKPDFTPPPIGFAIAWTSLSVGLAYAGARLLKAPRSPQRTRAVVAWSATLVGVASFNWVLFGRKQLDEALGATAAVLAASGALVATATPVDRRAALASVPLLGWATFATVLQERIWQDNP